MKYTLIRFASLQLVKIIFNKHYYYKISYNLLVSLWNTNPIFFNSRCWEKYIKKKKNRGKIWKNGNSMSGKFNIKSEFHPSTDSEAFQKPSSRQAAPKCVPSIPYFFLLSLLNPFPRNFSSNSRIESSPSLSSSSNALSTREHPASP